MGFICTTDDSEFEPRRNYPWDALSETLGRELGPEYGHLLAEPVPRRGEGRTDWYAKEAGPASLASALSGDTHTTVFALLEQSRRKILALADDLESPSRRSPDKGLAGELRNAIRVPDLNRHVWCLNGRPVLVAWGGTLFGRQDAGEIPLLGQGMAPTPDLHTPVEVPVAAEAVAFAPSRRVPWTALLWLVFAGLVVACYCMLLPACGIIVEPEHSWLHRFLPMSCHAEAAVDPLASLREKHEALEGLVRARELKVARREGDCAQTVQLPSPPVSSVAAQEVTCSTGLVCSEGMVCLEGGSCGRESGKCATGFHAVQGHGCLRYDEIPCGNDAVCYSDEISLLRS